MAKFRIISPNIWVDEKIWGDPTAKKRSLNNDEFKIFLFLLTGQYACNDTDVGIYSIHRGTIAMMTRMSLGDVVDALNFFNENRPELMEYDPKTHIVFIKSFFKHNDLYLNQAEKYMKAIKNDFDKTFNKCPRFWGEFAALNYSTLQNCADCLSQTENEKDYRNTLNSLFEERKKFLKNNDFDKARIFTAKELKMPKAKALKLRKLEQEL